MPDINYRIGFVGAGRIGKIFLEAWRKANLSNLSITLFDTDPDKSAELAKTYRNCTATSGIDELVNSCSILFLAIHPPAFQHVMPEIKRCSGKPELIISLSPKITIKQVQEGTGVNQIIRSIPNAPSVIGKGYNVYAAGPTVSIQIIKEINYLFSPLGEFVRVDEELLESYAAITGMGPTYLWFLFNHLHALAIKFGIPEQDAADAVNAMLIGASETLFTSGLSKEQILDLIPAYPLKPKESEITRIYSEAIESLYNKLKP